ncbi:hypothetical protein QWZ13_09825 [Reinekea marina]|nr:hypothetical protein [Reinekea marina]MDN3649209.1 hypothetical protein [Reinekea marina]
MCANQSPRFYKPNLHTIKGQLAGLYAIRMLQFVSNRRGHEAVQGCI